MLAAHEMSHNAQFIIYGIAFILFVVAAVIAWMAKAVWATFVASGLALFALVMFWNQLALS
jgi:hypothetical protein